MSILARFRSVPAIQYVTNAIKFETFLRREVTPKIPNKQQPLSDTIIEIAMKITNSVCYANSFNPQTEQEYNIRQDELHSALRNLETITTRIQVMIDLNVLYLKDYETTKQSETKKPWIITEHQLETMAEMIETEISLIRGVIASDRKRYKEKFTDKK